MKRRSILLFIFFPAFAGTHVDSVYDCLRGFREAWPARICRVIPFFLGSAVAREPALSPIFSVEFTIPAVVTVERLAVVAVERLAVVARTVVVKWAFSSPIFAVGITAIVARTLAR